MQGSLRAAVLVLALPVCAWGAPNYNYVQADWIADGKSELSGAKDARFDGVAGEVSFALGEMGFFRIDYSSIELNPVAPGIDSLDVDRSAMGFGLIRDEGDYVDLYGMASFERLEVDSEDTDGYGVTGGMRIVPLSWLEINPSLGYVDYGEIGDLDVSGLRYGVRVLVNVTERIGIVGGFEGTDFKIDQENVNDDPDYDLKKEWHLGARLSF